MGTQIYLSLPMLPIFLVAFSAMFLFDEFRWIQWIFSSSDGNKFQVMCPCLDAWFPLFDVFFAWKLFISKLVLNSIQGQVKPFNKNYRDENELKCSGLIQRMLT